MISPYIEPQVGNFVVNDDPHPRAGVTDKEPELSKMNSKMQRLSLS